MQMAFNIGQFSGRVKRTPGNDSVRSGERHQLRVVDMIDEDAADTVLPQGGKDLGNGWIALSGQ